MENTKLRDMKENAGYEKVRHGKNGRFESAYTDRRIKLAIEKLVRNRFCAIVRFSPWAHPLNTVLNCYALMLDGGIQYKFSLTCKGTLIVAEVRSRLWIDLPVQPSQEITWEQLEAMIPTAKTRDVFGMYRH